MKLYLSVDIEGITAAQHWDETTIGKPGHSRLAERMTRDTTTVCKAALAAGATELWVKDAHDSGRNMDPEALPEQTRLIRGWSGDPLCMVQELDASFQGLMMLGYHSSVATGDSPLAHSMSTRLSGARLNGEPASEMRLHALAASELGVPLILLSGDEGICREAEAWIPGLATVVTQRGRGDSVISRHPEAVRRELAQAAARVLGGAFPNPAPRVDRYRLELSYRSLADAARCVHYPGAAAAGPHGLSFEADSAIELLRAMLFLL